MSDTGGVTGPDTNENLSLRQGAPSGPPAILADASLAGVVLLIGLPTTVAHDGSGQILLLNVALTLGLACPLILRRRFPTAVFGVIAAVACLQWTLDVRLTADVALLVAFYTVAAYESRRATVASGLILAVGITMAVFRWSSPSESTWVMAGFLFATAATAGILGVNVQTRRRYLASVIEHAKRLEVEREQRERIAAAAERSRIAREMHDIVAHNLTVIVALAEGSTVSATADPAASLLAMNQVATTGRQALADMRRVLAVLEPEEGASGLTPQPGLAQISDLVERVRLTGLPTDFSVVGDPAFADDALQLVVYRIVQEAITNVLRHGPTHCVASVLLTFATDHVSIEVLNSGGPIDVVVGVHESGRGLRGMGERVALYDGSLECGPRIEGGWRVAATLDPSSDPAVAT